MQAVISQPVPLDNFSDSRHGKTKASSTSQDHQEIMNVCATASGAAALGSTVLLISTQAHAGQVQASFMTYSARPVSAN